MPEYDAFGREIGEDPLAGLREATGPAQAKPPEAAPEPLVPTPAPAEAAPPAPTAPERVSMPRLKFVRPRRRRGLAGLLVFAAVVGGLGLAANAVVEKSEDIIHGIASPEAEAPAPSGLQARSLVREKNFAAALRQLADAHLGRPIAIRVAPDRVDATLLADGRVRQAQVTADGELRELAAAPATGHAVSFAAIDPAAPERLVRRGATRRHPARSIGYVLVNAGPPITVGAYFKRGRIVIGDVHGRPQRVL